jgi:hypothetical protein
MLTLGKQVDNKRGKQERKVGGFCELNAKGGGVDL